MTDYRALIAEAQIYPPQRLARRLADAVEALDYTNFTQRKRIEEQRSRIAALEAVITQLRDEANAIVDTTRVNGTDFERGQENVAERVFDVLSVHPSTVLEQMIREAKAEAVAGWADWVQSASAHVPGITIEQVVAALRSGREPFGVAAVSEA